MQFIQRSVLAGFMIASWLAAEGVVHASEHGSSSPPPRTLAFVLPKGWAYEPSESRAGSINAFSTGQEGHVVGVGMTWPATETALQWATDELASIQQDDGLSKPASAQNGLRREGLKVVTTPSERLIGTKTWAFIVWDMPWTGQNVNDRSVTVRSRHEQYFWKDGDTIIQVMWAYPLINPEHLNREAFEQFLSTVRVATPQETANLP